MIGLTQNALSLGNIYEEESIEGSQSNNVEGDHSYGNSKQHLLNTVGFKMV